MLDNNKTLSIALYINNKNLTCIKLSLAVSIAFKVSRLMGILDPKMGVSKITKIKTIKIIEIYLYSHDLCYEALVSRQLGPQERPPLLIVKFK